MIFTLVGCRNELREINYNFSVVLQDSVFNDIEVGREISTPLIFQQKLEQPQYTVKFHYREELGTILFSDKELKDNEETEIKDVKNLRLGYRSTAVGKDTIRIELANAMLKQELKLIVSSVAKTGVTFPAYSFYESYSPNIPVEPTPMLIINNPADRDNVYKLIFERTEGNDLQGWLIDGDEKREMTDKQEMNLFSGVGIKNYRFEFLCKSPGTQKFRFVVLDKYGNRFESEEYTLQFEVKGKVDFPIFNFEESYSPNKKFRSKAILRIYNLTDKDNVYTVHYKSISGDILWLQLVDGEQEYLLSKLKSVKLTSKTGEFVCYFDLRSETQGTQKFVLEVSDKYGNTYKSPEYTISFNAKANVFFPRLSSEAYQTHVSNFVKGERMKVQGIDDSQNEFFATYETINGKENGFSMSLIQNSIEGVKLTQGEWYSIAKGTNEESFQYEIKQKKQGTTEFRVLVKDKYGNVYKSPVYRATFQDKYYGQVVLTMHKVAERITTLDSWQRRELVFPGLIKIAGVNDVNELKRWLADYRKMEQALGEKGERYVYSAKVNVFSDPELTRKAIYNFPSDAKLNIVIYAASEMYVMEIYEQRRGDNSPTGRISRSGRIKKGATKDFSIDFLPRETYLENILNYSINRHYPTAPNTTNKSDVGEYPLALFFGDLTNIKSIAIANGTTLNNFELVPKVEVYKQDSFTKTPYFVKRVNVSVR